MLEPIEETLEVTIEQDEVSESMDTPSDDLDVDTTSGFAFPSKTLIFALFLLTTTIGISLSAGFMLWSLSDHPVNPEASTSAQSEPLDN